MIYLIFLIPFALALLFGLIWFVNLVIEARGWRNKEDSGLPRGKIKLVGWYKLNPLYWRKRRLMQKLFDYWSKEEPKILDSTSQFEEPLTEERWDI